MLARRSGLFPRSSSDRPGDFQLLGTLTFHDIRWRPQPVETIMKFDYVSPIPPSAGLRSSTVGDLSPRRRPGSCPPAHSQRRLVSAVTKYEVKGDRVRYYSTEREEWEELPNDLVDWPATEKYEKDRAAGVAAPEAVQLDKEAEHDRELEAMERPASRSRSTPARRLRSVSARQFSRRISDRRTPADPGRRQSQHQRQHLSRRAEPGGEHEADH